MSSDIVRCQPVSGHVPLHAKPDLPGTGIEDRALLLGVGPHYLRDDVGGDQIVGEGRRSTRACCHSGQTVAFIANLGSGTIRGSFAAGCGVMAR